MAVLIAININGHTSILQKRLMADCSSLEYGDKRLLLGETDSKETWISGENQHVAAVQLKIMCRTPGKLIFIKEAD